MCLSKHFDIWSFKYYNRRLYLQSHSGADKVSWLSTKKNIGMIQTLNRYINLLISHLGANTKYSRYFFILHVIMFRTHSTLSVRNFIIIIFVFVIGQAMSSCLFRVQIVEVILYDVMSLQLTYLANFVQLFMGSRKS